MATPLVVDIEDRPRPKFKWHPFIAIEVDPIGAFSSILHGFIHNEDIMVYVHTNIDELVRSSMLNIYSK